MKKIEWGAFESCPRLKRLVMPGVEEVEQCAFCGCKAIEHIECKKLEIIGQCAFSSCKSLSSIDLPSAKIVRYCAFHNCKVLSDIKSGEHLYSLEFEAFLDCTSLEQITIPLKNGLIGNDYVF